MFVPHGLDVTDIFADRSVTAILASWYASESTISASTKGSSRGRLSISVTRTPSAANMLAYSHPTTPAPTTARVRGGSPAGECHRS